MIDVIQKTKCFTIKTNATKKKKKKKKKKGKKKKKPIQRSCEYPRILQFKRRNGRIKLCEMKIQMKSMAVKIRLRSVTGN